MSNVGFVLLSIQVVLEPIEEALTLACIYENLLFILAEAWWVHHQSVDLGYSNNFWNAL